MRLRRASWGLLFAFCLAAPGCTPKDNLFPLAVGRQWSYTVRTGFPTYVAQLHVTRELSVAGADGYELAGPLGISRVAWTPRGLVAERVISAQFNPPLLLVRPGDATPSRPWKGKMTLPDQSAIDATAEQSQSTELQTLGSKKVSTIRSTVLVEAGPRHIELTTWYAPGIGPIRQVQRNNGVQMLSATLLGSGQSGP